MSKGIADTTLLSASELDQRFGANNWLFAPSFVATQASGKKRLISNAKVFQNRATSLHETVGLCTAMNPGLVSRGFVDTAQR